MNFSKYNSSQKNLHIYHAQVMAIICQIFFEYLINSIIYDKYFTKIQNLALSFHFFNSFDK